MKTNPILKVASLYVVAILFIFTVSTITKKDDIHFNVWLGYVNPIVNLPTFIFGVAIGLYYIKKSNDNIHFSSALQIISVFFVIVSLWSCGTLTSGNTSALANYFRSTGPALSFVALILSLSIFGNGIISRSLSIGVFVYLGEISYSIYLTHQIVFRWWVNPSMKFDGLSVGIQYLMALALTFVMSALIFHLIERPSRTWLMSGWSRLNGAKPSSPSY